MTAESLVERNKSHLTTRMRLGYMYMFFYEAKHRKTLPYYDQFPVIFPFTVEAGFFIGINMHYLPLILRAKLMNALYTLKSDNKYDDRTRLRITYDVLNNARKFKLFRPTIHKYLHGQRRSRFLEIHATEWDIAMFLPVERFSGASKQKVWADSRKAVA